MLKATRKWAGSLRPSAGLVKGDGQPSNVSMRASGVITVHPPSWAVAIRAQLHHAAQLGNHIQALLLAHVLAGDLAGLLVGDSHSHVYTHLLPVADSAELVAFDPPSLTPG